MEHNTENTPDFMGFGMVVGFAAGVITTAGALTATWIAKRTAESVFNRIANK